MAKKKNAKKRRKKAAEKNTQNVKLFANEYLKVSLGIVVFSFGVVLFLAPFGVAGRFGTLAYEYGFEALGFGYFLIPISFFILSALLYLNKSQKIEKLKSLALFIFFISALSIIENIKAGAGGFVGRAALYPFVYAFDKIASFIILLAINLGSIFVLFETDPVKLARAVKSKIHGDNEEETEFEIKNKSVKELEGEEVSQNNEIAKDNTKGHTKEERQNKKTSSTSAKVVSSILKAKVFAKDLQFDALAQKDFGDYKAPPLSLLKKDRGRANASDVRARANAIKRTLMNFGIQVEMDEVTIGPTVTRYALKPAEGVRLNKIVSLQPNLELALAASPIRIEAPIPGKPLVGIEVPNTAKTTLGLADIIGSKEFYSDKYILPIALGKDIVGNKVIYDLTKAPHMIIAGATGAGKSVTIHDIILSFLYKYGPDKLRLLLVDPKMVELTLYDGVPHLLHPTITDAKKTILALKWLIQEMERRYDILRKHKVQNLKSYHTQILQKAIDSGKYEKMDENERPERLPYIVAVLDELADIMQMYPKELEAGIVRIAQKARAVGIHMILATQRPDTRTITGLIKANVPTRIALQVPSQIDSRTILDQGGAEKLLGAGDMLFLAGNMSKPKRIQAPFVSTDEIKAVVKHISKSYEGELIDEIDFDDAMKDTVAFSSGNLLEDDDDERNSDEYKAAVQFVIESKKASSSLLQRRFRIGYNKAARFIDMMEEDGIIGPPNGSKPREVLVESIDEAFGQQSKEHGIGNDNSEDLIEEAENDHYEDGNTSSKDAYLDNGNNKSGSSENKE